MKRFIIERNVKAENKNDLEAIKQGAMKSNEVLAKLAPKVQWLHSYATKDKTYCVYLAEDESYVRKHAEIGGFPIDNVAEVEYIVDPTRAS